MKLLHLARLALTLNGMVLLSPTEARSPKNIIIFISDGCGYNHIDAASYYEFGQKELQIYEQFPVKFALSTYSANGNGYAPDSAWRDFDYVRNKPTDSGAAGTAIATGVKTYNGAIGVNLNRQVTENVLEHFEKLSKATGVVTTVPFSHATPAAFGAHNLSRKNFGLIARDMLLNSKMEVIMGAGHPGYDADGQLRSDSSFKFFGEPTLWTELYAGKAGNDADGDSLIDYWTCIEQRTDFQRLMDGPAPKRVFGLARVAETLQQKRSGDKNAPPFTVPMLATVPTLAEMSLAALNVLDADPDGFCMMIEGGAVDWASHENQSGRMIEEEIDFNHAVAAVVRWVETHSSWEESLVIVTADHETGYLTGLNSGTSAAGQPIWNPLQNHGKGVLPGMEWHSGEHTNALIPFFAKGAASESLRQYADEIDPVRGHYLDNTEIAKFLFTLVNDPPRR